MKQHIYLDHAAATPMDGSVLEAMQPYFAEQFYNPSALYLGAKAVARDMAGARARIAGWLGARPGEIVFTAGGTEANNLAIQGIMRQYPEANVVVSAVEHESMLQPAHLFECREAPVLTDGRVDIEQLERVINDQTVLVSVMYANNEIGTIQPVKQIAELLRKLQKRRKNKLPLYFHTDACQAAAYLDLHTARLGVDLLTINGGKIYGPKQCGALYVRAGVTLAPQILGGGQEQNKRSGTENVAGIMGLAAALDLVQQRRHDEGARLQRLQALFMNDLEEKLPQATINGSRKQRLPNNIHLTLPGQDNERLIMALDEAGIQAAAGSACSTSNEEPSHVLRAIGLTDKEAQSSLRFTMGRRTTAQTVHRTVDTIAGLVAPN